MIKLSVNVNKIATLRNSRGGDIPNLVNFTKIILDSGADGITVHPRSDERHIKKDDVYELNKFIHSYNSKNHKNIEYNIEGEPSSRYMDLVLDIKPTQATLVPVKPGEITSDHGFDLKSDANHLKPIIAELKKANIRVSLFMEYSSTDWQLAKSIGVDRIEFYTGPFAELFEINVKGAFGLFDEYKSAAEQAIQAGLEINAGHDLDHINLQLFKKLPGLKEVSIGHRLMSYALEVGLDTSVQIYLKTLL